jgi:hypothetical protein
MEASAPRCVLAHVDVVFDHDDALSLAYLVLAELSPASEVPLSYSTST